jgi:hypothetical protein
MTRRSKVWRVIGALFALVNAGGTVAALLSGEPMHAAVHVTLLVATFIAWRVAERTGRRDLSDGQLGEERLDRLQQTLDDMALEVERIGEAQRYAVKVVSERARSSPP